MVVQKQGGPVAIQTIASKEGNSSRPAISAESGAIAYREASSDIFSKEY